MKVQFFHPCFICHCLQTAVLSGFCSLANMQLFHWVYLYLFFFNFKIASVSILKQEKEANITMLKLMFILWPEMLASRVSMSPENFIWTCGFLSKSKWVPSGWNRTARNLQQQPSAKPIKIGSVSRTILRHSGRHRDNIACDYFVLFIYLYIYVVCLWRNLIFKIFAYLEIASPNQILKPLWCWRVCTFFQESWNKPFIFMEENTGKLDYITLGNCTFYAMISGNE